MRLSIVGNVTKPGARTRARVSCVLLAAGGSKRLGRPKQLVRRRARPLLLHAVEAARRALGESDALVVVLGSNALKLRGVLQARAARSSRRIGPVVQVVHNAVWSDGLSSSLRTGLDELPRSASAALVLLVDQPDVDATALRRLIVAWRTRPGVPAAAHYAGRAGVPAILPRRLWSTIRALDGDAGARALLRDATEITLVPMPEAELDVDTEQDLARL